VLTLVLHDQLSPEFLIGASAFSSRFGRVLESSCIDLS
jgi:hypothetical protein